MERSSPRRLYGRLPWSRILPAIILALGVGLFVLAELKARATDRTNVRQTLELRADWRSADFEQKIASLVEPMNALARLVATQLQPGSTLNAEKFRHFAREVRGTNPISRLTWSPWVGGRNRAAFEREAQKGGSPDYAIRTTAPDSQVVLIPAPQESAYLPILFAEAFAGLPELLGYDFLSNPVRRAAAERARDEGRVVSTPAIRSIGSAGQDLHFTIFLPVYRDDAVPGTVAERRERLLGFVTGKFPLLAVMKFVTRNTPALPETSELLHRSCAGRALWRAARRLQSRQRECRDRP